MKTALPVVPSDNSIERHVPGDADENDGQYNRACDSEVPIMHTCCQAFKNRAELQTDEDKGENVHDEYDRFPHSVSWYANSRRYAFRCVSRNGHRVTNHRQYARKANLFGEYPHAECADELKKDRSRSVLHTFDSAGEEQRQKRTGYKAAGDPKQERRGNDANGKSTGCHSANRQPKNEERTRIIQQALAFEYGQNTMWRSERPEHGGCRRRIRWSYYRAESDRRRPRYLRNKHASDHGYRSGRKSYCKHNQAGERSPVILEISR